MQRKKPWIFFILLLLLTQAGCDIFNKDGLFHKPSPTETSVSAPYLTIINGLSENLTFIPRHGDTPVESTVMTGQSPNQIFRYEDRVYIVNSLSHSLTIYDHTDFSILHEFSTGTGTNPYKAVIHGQRIYITAYLTHQLLIFDLQGNPKGSVNLEILNEEDDKTYYPYPQGIDIWQEYIFIACMYSEENGATKTREHGRLAVYSITDAAITGYIETGAKDTNALDIADDTLYIISSGGYNSGFDETGLIELVDLQHADLESPGEIQPVEVAGNNSFGAFCKAGNRVWTGNLGNGTLKLYSTTNIPWEEQESKALPGGKYGMAYIPDIVYAESENELYVTEFNGNKIYVLDPGDLSVKEEHICSSNNYGDAQFMLLME